MRRRRRASGSGGPPQFYVAPVGPPASAGRVLGDQPEVPDLLHEPALAWGDLSGSVELVRYAFEGGDATGVFDALIEALPLAPTSFVQASFASQLYLDELVRKCFVLPDPKTPPNTKLLRRILESPPSEPAHCAVRQAIVAELAGSDVLRGDLTRYHAALRQLRSALEMEVADEPNLIRRKIGVLVALQRAVNALADGFVGATSRLRDLRAMGVRIRDQAAWERLTDLVDLEGNMAAVDVRLTLGSDGSVRGFGVLAVRERANDVLPGPFARFFERVFSFFRGYRYGESEVVVRLLEEVFGPFAEEVVAMLATTGPVELYLAALGFSDLAKAKGLAVSLPEIVSPDSTADRVIDGLFNPLLFLQEGLGDGKVLPCDVPVPQKDALVVITGPNSGGKTRLLQAIALTQLLGQVGIFVPAARARLVRAPNLFLSLVTDGDAAQVEGRLGTELLRIRKLFEELEPGTVALLDELCSGTNPNEGEEIFAMVLSLLPRLRPQLFVSTHFLGLAARLERERPVEHLSFLQVELDEAERPTFQFVSGVATTSLAHKVAERLGVTRQELEVLVEAKLARRS